jgi:hypothetical protein
VRAVLRAVLRTVRAVLRPVVFLVAIGSLHSILMPRPVQLALTSSTLHFLQTLPLHMTSQLLFAGGTRSK